MAFTAGYTARILNGDFSLSAKLAQVTSTFGVDILYQTTFADAGVKRSMPGLDSSTFACEGFIDAATAADNTAWTAAQPFTYGPSGLALGSPVFMVEAFKTDYEIGTQVGGITSFNITGQTDGFTDFGYSLKDLAAITSDTSGAAFDGTAATTAGGVAHLHVTAFAGFSGAVVIVEDSATGSSGWATIGTFTTVAGLTSQRLAIAGNVRRYLRYSIDVTGTGSVTFAVAVARR